MSDNDLLSITVDIVSAYVGANSVHPAELPDIIATVHASFAGLGTAKQADEPEQELKPAVPVKKSITPEFLICLDDGRRFKSLKRHLAQLGMTPREYRAKWGLSADYPMVAPGYAARRSELAKAIGLGSSRRTLAQADQLMNNTAMSPVAPETATLASVVEERQAEPEAAFEKQLRRRGRSKAI